MLYKGYIVYTGENIVYTAENIVYTKVIKSMEGRI